MGAGLVGRPLRVLDQRRGRRLYCDQHEPVMIICCEWLDDLPCPVVARQADGWREVIISDDGMEQAGAAAGK